MDSSRKVYIETYGCQMNEADTEVLLSILNSAGYVRTDKMANANILLVNTCAVRENAEKRVLGRLDVFNRQKKYKKGIVIGVLGCMAELKRIKLLEKNFIDLIVGPDEYRKLPALIESAMRGTREVATQLSNIETYEDITPLRVESISAWISIMRGCNNFCSFCVVPFARGCERSRSSYSILKEVEELSKRGYKEITLLGQNVNSYNDGKFDFAELLIRVADVDNNLRIRFTTSHPRDVSDKLIEAVASRSNICKSMHLPVQSGSNRILQLMNRNYTAEHYLSLIWKIRNTIPDVGLSTDVIAGFPTETIDDHKMTLELLQEVKFDSAFTFKYSPRIGTKAWSLPDNVTEVEKVRRLNEIIDLQRTISLEQNRKLLGRKVEVLVEGLSKKSKSDFCGRTSTNKMVVFPKNGDAIGSYIDVLIERVNSATLFGRHEEKVLALPN